MKQNDTIPPPTTPPLSITALVHRGPSLIHILGERSRHGWDIGIENGARLDFRKTKAAALKFAHDACEPGIKAIYVIQPHVPRHLDKPPE